MPDHGNVVFSEGQEELIDMIRPLWENLNRIHATKSRFFRQEYEDKSFEDRKSQLLKKRRLIRADLVRDGESGVLVAYCVSSIDRAENEGTIESIYVDEAYRMKGIGDKLMRRHLGWMEKNGVKRKSLSILDGNEDVLKFYTRYNFYPKLILMEQKTRQEET
jgi:ribosomal protein S18 acetylase RimI-like enzyme